MTDYPIGESGGYCEYEEGTAPKLENDVAFSKRVMEANELWIGDRVTAKMEKEFPDHDWVTAWEVVDVNVGSIKNTMHAMQVPLTAMLCVLIMLITLLMVKLLVVRETGQCHAKKHRLP